MSRRPTWWRDLVREPDLTAAKTILLGFIVICSLQVFLRFVLPVPLSWTEELASAFVIWMTFLGIIAVERKGTHIRVELVDEMLPPKAVAVLYGLFDLAILVCLVAIIWGGWETLDETAYQRTPALGIPLNALIAVVPLASMPLAYFVVRNALRRFRAAWS